MTSNHASNIFPFLYPNRLHRKRQYKGLFHVMDYTALSCLGIQTPLAPNVHCKMISVTPHSRARHQHGCGLSVDNSRTFSNLGVMASPDCPWTGYGRGCGHGFGLFMITDCAGHGMSMITDNLRTRQRSRTGHGHRPVAAWTRPWTCHGLPMATDTARPFARPDCGFTASIARTRKPASRQG